MIRCPYCSGRLAVVDTRGAKRQRRCKGCARTFHTTEEFDEVLRLTALRLDRAMQRIAQLKRDMRSHGMKIPDPVFLDLGPASRQPAETKGTSRA